MTIINKINYQRDLVVEELFEWAESFLDEKDWEGEQTLEPYKSIFNLAERLKYGKCSIEDYLNIEFHIWQINYNELRIKL